MSQLELFITYLQTVANRTPDTVTRYRTTVKEFLDLVGGEKKTYTKADVEALLAKQFNAGAGGAYRRYTFYCLKAFFRHRGIAWPFEKSEVPKLEEPTRRWYAYSEIEKILAAAKGLNKRDWLMFRMVTVTMGRRKTLSLLKRVDFDPEKGTVQLPSIKRGRTPTVELDPETSKELVEYLIRRTDIQPALFASMRSRDGSGAIRLPVLNWLLQKYCKLAGVENKGMHAFRRGMVTYYHRQGLDVKQIWALGDWKSESQVLSYIQLDDTYPTETRSRLHPFWHREVKEQRFPTAEEKKLLKETMQREASRPAAQPKSD